MKAVIITDEAKFDIAEIEEYLLKKWNIDVLLDFNDKFDKAIHTLRSGNVLFEKYENTEFRKFLLTKHNTIIYKIDDETIFIVKILQNFQDPNGNEKSLKS